MNIKQKQIYKEIDNCEKNMEKDEMLVTAESCQNVIFALNDRPSS